MEFEIGRFFFAWARFLQVDSVVIYVESVRVMVICGFKMIVIKYAYM